MSLIEITEVVRVPCDPLLVCGASIDSFEGRQSFDRYAFPVAGWVVGTEGPVAKVRIYHQRMRQDEMPATNLRPDVAAAYPAIPWAGTSGFTSEVSVLGLPPTFELDVRAILKHDDACNIARIRGSRQSLFGNMATLGGAPSLSQGGGGSAVGGSAPAVPEPGTLALLGVCAISLLVYVRRRR